MRKINLRKFIYSKFLLCKFYLQEYELEENSPPLMQDDFPFIPRKLSGFLGIKLEYDSLPAGPRIANNYFMN